MKAVEYGKHTPCVSAFVSTNSICQGQQVPILWPIVFDSGHEIIFAHTSFKWANLASYNAGVIVVIVGLSNQAIGMRTIYSSEENNEISAKQADNINAYLVAGPNVIVNRSSRPLSKQAEMSFGSKPVDGGHLLMSQAEAESLELNTEQWTRFIRRTYGSAEFIRGLVRYCLWIEDRYLEEARNIEVIRKRIESVCGMRLASSKTSTREAATVSHRFGEIRQTGTERTIIVPSVSSENREYLPVDFESSGAIITNLAFAIFNAPIWQIALIASRLHLAWIAIVCGRMGTSFRYSNTIGWNTFPIPTLTTKNKADLTKCAEDILLARETHFPSTIADLYDPETMPENLRQAHERNDEVIERIYIGRRFKKRH